MQMQLIIRQLFLHLWLHSSKIHKPFNYFKLKNIAHLHLKFKLKSDVTQHTGSLPLKSFQIPVKKIEFKFPRHIYCKGGIPLENINYNYLMKELNLLKLPVFIQNCKWDYLQPWHTSPHRISYTDEGFSFKNSV